MVIFAVFAMTIGLVRRPHFLLQFIAETCMMKQEQYEAKGRQYV